MRVAAGVSGCSLRSGVNSICSVGILKEEVWIDERNEIVKYSLAYIHHSICSVDNGRVLGYDNAHGRHDRHRLGQVEAVPFTTYQACVQSFLEEVRIWRERT